VTTVLYTAFCGCALIFVAGAIARAVRYARSPIHLRWELYPVPHEGPARAAYGGSYFEEGEWWRSRRRVRLAGDLRFMFVEMLFLRALREFNRPLWFRSFPFHFGLYLLVLAGGLALIAAGGAVSLQSGLPGPLLGALRWASAAAGMAGLLLAVTGALALLHRRLTDPSLRPYTTAGDVFNLVLFVVALGAVGLGHVTKAAGSPGIASIVMGLLSWDTTLDIPPVLGGGLVAVALLAAYIPWTHMSHFIGKYFTYHAVRWDDTPLGDNRRVAEAMAAYLTRRPTWSAGHIRGNGTPTWAEVASSNPAREAK
jgi:nitrate reductase gamma subunit